MADNTGVVSKTGVANSFTKTYTTFSGVDITALFDNMMVMTMQGIAISITREKVPIYVFGRSRPVSISRGKRGIAGTLQFVLFDRDALNTLMLDADHQYYAHADEVNWLTNTFNPANYQLDAIKTYGGGSLSSDLKTSTAPGVDANNKQTGGWQSGTGSGTATQAVGRSKRTIPQYMDQIWPFDVTLMAQNEYGLGAWSSVIGIEIINEGGGISMDDLTNEEQATYIAIHRQGWTSLESVDRRSSSTDYVASSVGINSNGEIDVTSNGSITPPKKATP